MNEIIIRIQKIELSNLKNVGKETIQFTCNMTDDIFEDNTDLLDTYQQNASRKTILIYALGLFKSLVTGNKLVKDCDNYIKSGTESAFCMFELSMIDAKRQQFKIIYEFELKRNEEEIEQMDLLGLDKDKQDDNRENQIYVSMEKVSTSKLVGGKWSKLTPVLGFCEEDDTILSSKIRRSQLIADDKNIEEELRVTRLLMKKLSKSFLFSEELNKIIQNSKMEIEHKNLFNVLREYPITFVYY